jgi:hypothetical protein
VTNDLESLQGKIYVFFIASEKVWKKVINSLKNRTFKATTTSAVHIILTGVFKMVVSKVVSSITLKCFALHFIVWSKEGNIMKDKRVLSIVQFQKVL